jgi:site-specific DNA recombinase
MTGTKPQRSSIYIRQSQTHDGTISPELQEKNIRRFIKGQEKWTVTDVYSDIDISGLKEENRPSFLKLKADYASGKFDVAVADEFTRFSRNAVDGISLLGTMKIATAKEGIPPEDDFMPSLYFLLSAKFSKEMGLRWKHALMHRLSKGLPPSGKPHFGYDKQGKDAYVPNADAEIIREAYARYTAGEGAPAICKDFTARQLPSAGPAGWQPRGLFDLLDKSFYAGKISFEGQDFPGAHEPLLNKSQWAAYRKARDKRKKQTTPRNPKWMLSGLVVCGRCGGKMVSNTVRGVASLTCSTYNAKGKAGCKGTFRKREVVMRKFRFWLHKHREEWANAMPSDDEAKTAAETAVADAQAAYDSAVEDYSRYQQWAYENAILPAVSAKTLAEKSEAVTTASAALEEAQAELGSFVPASTVMERINAGIKVLGLDMPENDESLGEEPTEQETAVMREIYSRMIERIVILPPPPGMSSRHPDRDLMAEIEVYGKF